MTTARKVISRLMEEKSVVLSDVTPKSNDNIDLSNVNAGTPPSELKRLSDAIKIKRITAPGLSDSELKALMLRIGK